jgi:ADP-ribosyl-[dinitrogen reductase] hydrolase
MQLIERYKGALLGLAAGDALGTTLEFRSPGSFEPIDDMVGGGPFKLPPGYWTDDTSMALCLAESLIEQQGFDAADQMTRYVRWWQEGHLSSTDSCFDIGNTVRQALQNFRDSGKPFAGSTDKNSAGNGSLMRLAPLPLAFRQNDAQRWQHAVNSSATTHGARACLDACGLYSELIVRALDGASRATILDTASIPPELFTDDSNSDILAIAKGSYTQKMPPEIKGTGYVVDAIEAALWAFHHSDSFEEGALMAVNLGDDADTTGAIFGQLAGAFYGESGIPAAWRERLTQHNLITEYAEQLCALSERL